MSDRRWQFIPEDATFAPGIAEAVDALIDALDSMGAGFGVSTGHGEHDELLTIVAAAKDSDRWIAFTRLDTTDETDPWVWALEISHG